MTHPFYVLTLCGRKSELTVARSVTVSGESLLPQITILKNINNKSSTNKGGKGLGNETKEYEQSGLQEERCHIRGSK